ncbi:MAG: SDR family oxidoreductase [Verrucomicrobiae bacterium]|nr:SDR family oxidoreductase [Verrucomicrobiae bacterium]
MITIDFTNKVAIVTGSGSGIGRAIAKIFARAGAKVVVNDLNTKGGEKTVEDIEKLGGEAIFVRADVSMPADGARLARTAYKKFGALHTLVNNAGVASFKTLMDTSFEDWNKTMAVDLGSIYCCSRPAIPLIEKSGGGSIVNIASVHARSTIPGIAAYAGAKGGVVTVTRAIALELARRNIRVNAICPGFTHTELYDWWINTFPNPKKKHAEACKLQPTGKLVQPEDIGHTALFLASDLSKMINGTAVYVDGALTARLYND